MRVSGCSGGITEAFASVVLFPWTPMLLPQISVHPLAVTALPAHRIHISELAGMRSRQEVCDAFHKTVCLVQPTSELEKQAASSPGGCTSPRMSDWAWFQPETQRAVGCDLGYHRTMEVPERLLGLSLTRGLKKANCLITYTRMQRMHACTLRHAFSTALLSKTLS